jgi:hypothetical protein
LKKTFKVKSKNGKIVISFPNVKAGQAIISAIAIGTKNRLSICEHKKRVKTN